MWYRKLFAAAVLTASLVMPRAVAAQTPWTVTITPTLNPLPIGLCGAVQIRLMDASGNARPRNPAGYLMGLADFDMSVTATDPAAVVGQQIDASHWSVCACQAGTRGTVATITASYPSRQLSPRARTPGVTFQTTETVTLAAAAGRVNPPGCPAPTQLTIAPGGVVGAPATPTASNTMPTTTLIAPPPPVTVAQAPLTVVLRAEYTVPPYSLYLSPGYCMLRSFDDARILITDTAIVTGQAPAGANNDNMKWTATARNGTILITFCSNANSAFLTSTLVNVSYMKANILVLR